MGLKFRRRQKLFPGVYVNFSSKGISTTVGIKGLSINFDGKGTYLNTGVPGTGFSHREKIYAGTSEANEDFPPTVIPHTPEGNYFLPQKLEGEIKSSNANSVTSQGLAEVKETLLAAYQEKNDLLKEIPQVEKEVKSAAFTKLLSQIFLIGLFTKKFEKQLIEKEDYLNDLKQQLLNCKVKIDIEIDEKIAGKYERLKNSFSVLSQCSKIWDKTSSTRNNDNRSAATNSVTRTQTTIGNNSIDFINASFEALHFKNHNGSDIYIYPCFIVLFDDKHNFGMVDLADLQIVYKPNAFLEEEQIPPDTEVIGETWAKVNKNGTPDKRFKDNYRIPIVQYAEIAFSSATGVNESFMFSNPTRAKSFAETFNEYVLQT